MTISNLTISEINAFDLKSLQAQDEAFYLIDVREIHEWQKAYIPGAIHLSMAKVEDKISDVVADKDDLIVLYCASGYRSAVTAATLQNMGYKKVVSLQGGINDWLNNQQVTPS